MPDSALDDLAARLAERLERGASLTSVRHLVMEEAELLNGPISETLIEKIRALVAIWPLEGIIWPASPNGMEDLPYVERDDDFDTYNDDIEAARAVSKLTGTPVMFVVDDDAPAGEELSHCRPFVLPYLSDLAIENPDWAQRVRACLYAK